MVLIMQDNRVLSNILHCPPNLYLHLSGQVLQGRLLTIATVHKTPDRANAIFKKD